MGPQSGSHPDPIIAGRRSHETSIPVLHLDGTPRDGLDGLPGSSAAIGQVRRVEILGREAPALGGRSFGDVGRYEKIEGRVHGEVHPGDPRNRLITDLGLAPRNAAGKVEYAADFVLLKPMDMARASGILRYVAPNRGGADIAADPYFLARGEVFLWALEGTCPGAGPARPRCAGGAEPGRIADHRHRPRRVRRPPRRPARRDPAAGQRLQSRPGALSPGSTRRSDGGPDTAPQRGRPPTLHPPGRLGVRRE